MVWQHERSALTMLWFGISIPLVIWDMGYVFLRPHSMPGGYLHEPIWKPYGLYSRIDYVYGFPAFDSNDGFTGAQSFMNLVETTMYLVYVALVLQYQTTSASGKKVITGSPGILASMIGYSAAVMTFSKTVLYGLNEYCSGFKHIGHNEMNDLILLWILPNGAWIVFPAYMIYNFGSEIWNGLANSGPQKLTNGATNGAVKMNGKHD